MANKPKSFLANRSSAQPNSASDDDFALVMQVGAQVIAKPIYSQDIPVERIRPNPFQARQKFEGLEELAEVIRTQGFISRLRVRPDPNAEGFFQLIYGERRLRAAKQAGLNRIPCDVAEHNDKEMLEIGLAENIQRQDLSPLEEAQAFEKFIEAGNYTIRELADRLGKNKDYIAGRLSLLKAPPDVQHLVAQRPDTVTVARRIAQLKTPRERAPLIEAVLSGILNKEEVRNIVQEMQQLNTSGVVRPDVQNQAFQTVVDPIFPDVQTLEQNNLANTSNLVRPDVQNPEATTHTTKSTEQAPAKTLQSKLEREKATILTILGRWQEEAAKLEPDSRAQIQKTVQAVQAELQKLSDQLEKA